MMPKPRLSSRRTWLLAAAVAIVLAAAGLTVREIKEAPPAPPRQETLAAQNPEGSKPAEPIADGTARDEAPTPTPDIFAVRSWEPPPPPPPPPAPPPPPQAPPLPFRFIGRIAEGPDTAFMLVRRDQVISVRVGDTIDALYHLEKFEGGQLHFMYRPLNIRQTLFVGTGS